MRSTAFIAALLAPVLAFAQELEPRAYSNAPIGTNFLLAGYVRSSGRVLLDPSLPVTDIDASIDAYTLGYARYFALFGRTTNFSAVLPFVEADLRGSVMDAPAEVHRSGFGDLRLRGAINLFGHPALAPAEFARHPESLSGGVSLSVIAPTGQYEASRFINIGANRWAFKPEAGISYPIGNWFTEAAAGVWFFTDNDSFSGGQRRSQAPITVLQLHAGYSFRPGFWLAGDYGYHVGGRTAVNGVDNDDEQRNSRIGLALSMPLGAGWSTKLGWSKGAAIRAGGDYRTVALALQYRFLD